VTAKIRTTGDVKAELERAQNDLTATQARSAELEAGGDVSEPAVAALAQATARASILRASIRRLQGELPALERSEIAVEIERLTALSKSERAAGDEAAATLAAKASKLLVPPPESHPAWSYAYCARRKHEVGLFAAEHPLARVHYDAARDAAAEIGRLQNRLRELAG